MPSCNEHDAKNDDQYSKNLFKAHLWVEAVQQKKCTEDNNDQAEEAVRVVVVGLHSAAQIIEVVVEVF